LSARPVVDRQDAPKQPLFAIYSGNCDGRGGLRIPHKKANVAKRAKTETPRCRGASQIQCGPLYYNGDYFGDDPDPFIRSQIMRDVSGHYGGGEN
jgi:hypothetical protein